MRRSWIPGIVLSLALALTVTACDVLPSIADGLTGGDSTANEAALTLSDTLEEAQRHPLLIAYETHDPDDASEIEWARDGERTSLVTRDSAGALQWQLLGDVGGGQESCIPTNGEMTCLPFEVDEPSDDPSICNMSELILADLAEREGIEFEGLTAHSDVIAERGVTCFNAVDLAGVESTELCFDDATGLILRQVVWTGEGADSEVLTSLEAVAVTEDVDPGFFEVIEVP